jgi:hypothetical protein
MPQGHPTLTAMRGPEPPRPRATRAAPFALDRALFVRFLLFVTAPI